MTEQRRLIFHMSPSKKEKLQLLRTRLYKSNTRTGDYQRLYHHYKKQLENDQKEMAALRDEGCHAPSESFAPSKTFTSKHQQT